MSAVLPVVATQEAPPLSRSVISLLNILGVGAGGGRLRVAGRSRAGVGERCHHMPAGERAWIDESLLTSLEEDYWALAVALPVLDEHALSPLRVSALAATWSVPPVYINPRKPEAKHGQAWLFDEAGLQASAARAMAAPWGPPTMLVDARAAVVAVWALREPIKVREREADARARLLLQALAATLNATVPESEERLEDFTIPLPGTVVRDLDGFSYVTCAELDPARVYDLVAIEAALVAAKKGKGKS